MNAAHSHASRSLHRASKLVIALVFLSVVGASTQLHASNEPDDVRLYRSDWYAFSPQGERIRLSRCQEKFAFPESIGNNDKITDDYRLFPFYLAHNAILSVRVYSDSETDPVLLVPPTEVTSGSSYFVVTYDQLRQAIGDSDNDFVIKIYQHEDVNSDGSSNIAEYPGVLTYYRAGIILDNIVQYDVNITDGELSIDRKDFKLESFGPGLSLSRTFKSNWPQYSIYSTYGPGWSFNKLTYLDILAHGEEETPFNQPQWVLDQVGSFQSYSNLPVSNGEPRLIRFNNSQYFKRAGERWIPHMGFHGRVDEDENGFVFVAKDGTRYHFEKPELLAIDDPKGWFDDNEREVQQGYLTMPGIKPPIYVSRILDANDNALTYTYTPSSFGRLLQRIDDEVGRSVAFKYGKHETNMPETMPYRIVEIEGPNRALLEFEYNEKGMLTKFKNGVKSEVYRYRERDFGSYSRYALASTTDGRGYSKTFEYLSSTEIPDYILTAEPFNPYKEVVNKANFPDGSVGIVQYPEQDRFQRLVYDFMGNATEYRLNRYGNPVSILEAEGTLTEMEWSDGADDVDLLMISRHARPDAKVTYQHDSQGNVIYEQEEGGATTVTEWNLDYSEVIKRVFPSGGIFTAELDDNGNAIVKQWPDGTKYQIKYNDRGQKIELKVNNGVTITYLYDLNGYMSKEIHSSDGETEYVHDKRGLLLKKTDSKNESIWKYDNLGRKIYEKNDEGEYLYEYDSEDNLVVSETVGKRLVKYYYDERERVIKIILNDEYIATYTYDRNSNTLTKKDYNGVVRHYHYNKEDEQLVDPMEVKQAGLPVQRGR